MTDEEILEGLHRDGLVVLPGRMDTGPFLDHLGKCPVYQNHVRQGKPNSVPLGSYPWTCHDMHDVIRSPGLLEMAEYLNPLAGKYLEADPLLYSLNAFYCEPSGQVKGDIQDWHRDADDVRFLALFVYLTDVMNEADGPHQFFCGSQRGQPNDGDYDTIFGSAGTMFLADTSGVHRGLLPLRKRRMIAWARWGVSDPPAAYGWDQLRPLPAGELGERAPRDEYARRAMRLVVA